MSEAVFASGGDTIKVWNGDDLTVLKEYNHHKETVNNIRWNSTNDKILSTSGKSGQISVSGINLFKPEKSELIGVYGADDEQCCACFTSDDSSIISGGACGDVYMYNVKLQQKVKKFSKGPKEPISCIALNDRNTKVIVGNTAGNISLWNMEDARYIGKMENTNSNAVRAIQWNYFSKETCGIVGDSGSVCLWDINKQSLKHEFVKSHSAPVMDLSFSPLNNLLMVSCGLDKKIVLHDIKRKTAINVKTVDQPLTSVCLAQNGVNLFAGSFLGKLYKYDLRKTTKPVNVVKAHDSAVQCMTRQYTPNRRTSKLNSSGTSPTQSTVLSHNEKTQNSHDHSTVDMNTKQHIVIDSNSPKVSENVKNAKGELPASLAFPSPITNGKSPAGKHQSLLRRTLDGNSTISSRDSLGSYCEDIMSPLRKDVLMTSPLIKSNNSSQNGFQNHSIASSKNSNFNSPNNNGLSNNRKDFRKSSTPMATSLQNIVETSENLSDVFPSPANRNSSSKTQAKENATSNSNTIFNSRNSESNNEHSNLVSMDVLNAALKVQSDLFMNALKQQSESLLSAMQLHAEDMQEKNIDSHNHQLHEVSKLLFKQQQKYKESLEQYSLNPVLLAENERLRHENEKLQRFY